MTHGRGESDSAIVAGKPTNEAERTATEPVEPRAEAEGNVSQQSTGRTQARSEEHTSELQSQSNLVCRLLLEKKNVDAAGRGETDGFEKRSGLLGDLDLDSLFVHGSGQRRHDLVAVSHELCLVFVL